MFDTFDSAPGKTACPTEFLRKKDPGHRFPLNRVIGAKAYFDTTANKDRPVFYRVGVQ